jgi:oligopeptide/dipeptide ABC transporter ATP-binding protein
MRSFENAQTMGAAGTMDVATNDFALSVRDLSVNTSGRNSMVIVANVNLNVRRSEVLAIVGETGAGKTLMVRSWFGLLPHGICSTGTLTMDGADYNLSVPGKLVPLRGRQIAIVMQDVVRCLDPLQTIGVQLIEAVVRRKMASIREATARATQLLDVMGIAQPERVSSLYPHELSGGMLQRVAIALAMMPQPKVIVADEPTSALDASSRTDVLNLFRRCAREQGAAVILVSHDLALVGEFCDRVAVMYAGRVVEAAAVHSILRSPRHPYAAALLRCAPSLSTSRRVPLASIPGLAPAPGTTINGCSFASRCTRVVDRCRAVRPEIQSFGSSQVACHVPIEYED